MPVISTLQTRVSPVLLNVNETLIITTAGHTLSTAGDAISGVDFSTSNLTVMVQGEVTSVLGNGIIFGSSTQSANNDQVYIGSEGVVSALSNGVSIFGTSTTVNNAGTILAGAVGISVSGATAHIQNSGTIIADNTAIFAQGASASVINTGQLTADEGIFVFNAASARVSNSGHISALSSSGLGNGITMQASTSEVRNSGVIEATRNGIDLGSSTVTAGSRGVVNSGSVMAGLTGLRVDLISTIDRVGLINSGQINGGANAVDAGGTGRIDITNLAGGSLTSVSLAAIDLDGELGGSSITNYGFITSSRGLAIDLTGLNAGGPVSVLNHGVIDGGVFGGPVITLLRNFGTVDTILLGNTGDQVRNGGLIDGSVILGSGADTYTGRNGVVDGQVDGGRDNDTLIGGDQADSMTGGAEDDLLRGAGGDDVLLGSTGNDVVIGGAGDDTVNGGAGVDALDGGTGADVFEFLAVQDSGLGILADTIRNFEKGVDVIDLAALPATTFIGGAAFGQVAGEVQYIRTSGRLSLDSNGDGVADFELVLSNRPSLTVADILL